MAKNTTVSKTKIRINNSKAETTISSQNFESIVIDSQRVDIEPRELDKGIIV